MAVPPNLDPAIAKQVIEYLKANPEAAQQSYEQAHRMLQAPGMAQMLLDAKVSKGTGSNLLNGWRIRTQTLPSFLLFNYVDLQPCDHASILMLLH